MNHGQTTYDTVYPPESMDYPSSVVGEHSLLISNALRGLTNTLRLRPPIAGGIEERLFDSRAACKKLVANLAMPMLHLSKEWRDRFFVQIDTLLDPNEWDKNDLPISEVSFLTLIQMVILLRPKRRPGLGTTADGHILAVWKKDGNRLTVECLPDNRVRWVVLAYFDGKRETVVGENDLARLPSVLNPYHPEQWLADEGSKAAG